MKKLSVSELAKLYGYSRQAIYAHINKGNLSKGSDGLIDFSEALRVFGEPQSKVSDVNLRQSTNSQNLTEVDLLKRQVDILEKQLNQALLRENQSLERESFYQEQIDRCEPDGLAPWSSAEHERRSAGEFRAIHAGPNTVTTGIIVCSIPWICIYHA
jgi:predicted DNA-binding protein YlxM (UPF0122 family)